MQVGYQLLMLVVQKANTLLKILDPLLITASFGLSCAIIWWFRTVIYQFILYTTVFLSIIWSLHIATSTDEFTQLQMIHINNLLLQQINLRLTVLIYIQKHKRGDTYVDIYQSFKQSVYNTWHVVAMTLKTAKTSHSVMFISSVSVCNPSMTFTNFQKRNGKIFWQPCNRL